jgi:hypothetical protein
MTDKITAAAVVITAASTLYVGVQVQLLRGELDRSTTLAVQQFERDLFARQDAMARAQQNALQQAQRRQQAQIIADLNSIPQVLLEGR